MNTLRKTGIPEWFEYYREVCPVCGHRGMCMVNIKDTNKVVCCRVPSDIEWGKNSALPGWLHFLNGETRKIRISDTLTVADNPKKNDSYLNRVYRALLNEMNLREYHLELLKGPTRKMTENEIKLREYRSFPEKPYEVVKKVIERLGSHEDVVGVPGFYSKEGQYGRYFTLSGFSKSILIPYRNIKNEIVGFQWRVDEVKNQIVYKKRENGFSAFEKDGKVIVKYHGEKIFEGELQLKKEKRFLINGRLVGSISLEKGTRYMWLSSANKESGTGAGPLPVHVAVPIKRLEKWKTGEVLTADTVTVTEGPLKADISAELFSKLLKEEEKEKYGEVVLSTAGINTWRILLPILKKMKVKRVNLAFDMDVTTNGEVFHHFKECFQKMLQEGYEVNLFFWEMKEGKGLDDLLISGLLPIVINGRELLSR